MAVDKVRNRNLHQLRRNLDRLRCNWLLRRQTDHRTSIPWCRQMNAALLSMTLGPSALGMIGPGPCHMRLNSVTAWIEMHTTTLHTGPRHLRLHDHKQLQSSRASNSDQFRLRSIHTNIRLQADRRSLDEHPSLEVR